MKEREEEPRYARRDNKNEKCLAYREHWLDNAFVMEWVFFDGVRKAPSQQSRSDFVRHHSLRHTSVRTVGCSPVHRTFEVQPPPPSLMGQKPSQLVARSPTITIYFDLHNGSHDRRECSPASGNWVCGVLDVRSVLLLCNRFIARTDPGVSGLSRTHQHFESVKIPCLVSCVRVRRFCVCGFGLNSMHSACDTGSRIDARDFGWGVAGPVAAPCNPSTRQSAA